MSANSKIAALIIVIAVVIIGMIWLQPADNTSTPSEGSLSFSESSWNFGTISMRDGLATKEITITNESDTAVTITRMETSCMCTKAQIIHEDGEKSGIKGMVGHGGSPTISETIESGETATLVVNFDPNAHGPDATGPISRKVTLQTNGVDQEVILKFSGNVIK